MLSTAFLFFRGTWAVDDKNYADEEEHCYIIFKERFISKIKTFHVPAVTRPQKYNTSNLNIPDRRESILAHSKGHKYYLFCLQSLTRLNLSTS